MYCGSATKFLLSSNFFLSRTQCPFIFFLMKRSSFCWEVILLLTNNFFLTASNYLLSTMQFLGKREHFGDLFVGRSTDLSTVLIWNWSFDQDIIEFVFESFFFQPSFCEDAFNQFNLCFIKFCLFFKNFSNTAIFGSLLSWFGMERPQVVPKFQLFWGFYGKFGLFWSKWVKTLISME